VEDIELLVTSGIRDLKVWLGKIFTLAEFLGVKSERDLFQFMVEKQRGRIAQKGDHLPEAEKEAEWQRLLPLASQLFTSI